MYISGADRFSRSMGAPVALLRRAECERGFFTITGNIVMHILMQCSSLERRVHSAVAMDLTNDKKCH
jgi:hypothetical protein